MPDSVERFVSTPVSATSPPRDPRRPATRRPAPGAAGRYHTGRIPPGSGPGGRCARASTRAEGQRLDLYEYQGKQMLARHGIPVPDGRVATTPAEARPRPRRSAAPWSSRRRCRSAAAARPAASSWPRTPARPRPAPRGSSAWTSAATPSSGSGSRQASEIAKEYYALGHLRPRREEAAGHALRRGRRRHRGGRRRTGPRRSRACTSTRSSGFQPYHARWLVLPRRHRRARRSRAPPRSSGSCTRRSSALDAMLVEINPLILTDGRAGDRARRQGHHRRQRARTATPSWRSSATPRRRPAGAGRPGEGRQLHQARRRRRHHRQRRRPGDEHPRRGRPGRRHARRTSWTSAAASKAERWSPRSR